MYNLESFLGGSQNFRLCWIFNFVEIYCSYSCVFFEKKYRYPLFLSDFLIGQLFSSFSSSRTVTQCCRTTLKWISNSHRLGKFLYCVLHISCCLYFGRQWHILSTCWTRLLTEITLSFTCTRWVPRKISLLCLSWRTSITWWISS